MNNRESLLLDRLCKSYKKDNQEIKAVVDFSLQIKAGEITAICGPSGCGKTSLLLLSGGLLTPDSGRVLAEGREISRLNADGKARWRSTYCGFVFQQYHLVPYLSVKENILAPELALGRNEDRRERAGELCRILGLDERKQHYPGELSAGEKQRVALARALITEPAVLLADEITGNLDEPNSQMVLNLLREYSLRGGSVLMVTHDLKAADAADRIIHMEKGKIAEDG